MKNREHKDRLAEKLFNMLENALSVCLLRDERIKSEFEALGDCFCFSITARPGGPARKFTVKQGGLLCAEVDGHADIEIIFKHIDGAIEVLSGKKSAAKAFAEHAMTVGGSINKAVALMRVINIVEAYLLPRAAAGKIMQRVPERKVSRIYLIKKMLDKKNKQNEPDSSNNPPGQTETQEPLQCVPESTEAGHIEERELSEENPGRAVESSDGGQEPRSEPIHKKDMPATKKKGKAKRKEKKAKRMKADAPDSSKSVPKPGADENEAEKHPDQTAYAETQDEEIPARSDSLNDTSIL